MHVQTKCKSYHRSPIRCRTLQVHAASGVVHVLADLAGLKPRHRRVKLSFLLSGQQARILQILLLDKLILQLQSGSPLIQDNMQFTSYIQSSLSSRYSTYLLLTK